MVDYEIIRYKCQAKEPNGRWLTVKIYHREEDAEKWLRAALKCNVGVHRVIREEVMRIFEEA